MFEYEKRLVETHLKSLSADDRFLRFGHVLNDKTIDKYVDEQWAAPGEWYAIFDDDIAVGVIHVAVTDREAEFGISVDGRYRNLKIGQKLFERAVIYVRSQNIKHIYMHCLSQNEVIKHIAKKHDMTLVTTHGETQAHAVIDFPYTPLDSLNETVARQLAIYDNNVRMITKHMVTGWGPSIERIWNDFYLKNRN